MTPTATTETSETTKLIKISSTNLKESSEHNGSPTSTSSAYLKEEDDVDNQGQEDASISKSSRKVNNKSSFTQTDIVWRNVIAMIILHVIGIYGYYSSLTGVGSFKTIIWYWAVGLCSGFGTLAGAHRLWSHKSYKAKWPLRVILMVR